MIPQGRRSIVDQVQSAQALLRVWMSGQNSNCSSIVHCCPGRDHGATAATGINRQYHLGKAGDQVIALVEVLLLHPFPGRKGADNGATPGQHA